MTIILIGLMHGIPVVLIAYVFGSKKLVYISAGIMALIGGFYGDPSYMFIDWLGVIIGALFGLMALKR